MPDRRQVARFRPAAIGSLLAIVTVALSSCIATGASDAEAANEAEVAIRSLMAAWERGDEALLQELFWPQATYDDFPNQHVHEGIQEITDYVNAMHTWADDVYMSVGAVHATANGAVAEWVFSAVQNRPLGSQVTVGTGREVVTNGVTIIELEGGRIMRAADYFDTAPMLLQLGGRIELPGGTVLELNDGR